MNEQQRIVYLYERYLSGSISSEEQTELEAYLSSGNFDEEIKAAIASSFTNAPTLFQQNTADAEAIFQHIIRGESAPVVPLKRKPFGWIKYAAAVIVLASAAWLITQNANQRPAVQIADTQDAQPGRDRAVLVLSDGTTINLDSAANGDVAFENGTGVRKEDDKIIYAATANNAGGEITYNTMMTPRGGEYQLHLPDGTKVWLNAASSITYPVFFAGNTREVKVSGEAYFEVAKNASKPFIVSVENPPRSIASGASPDPPLEIPRRFAPPPFSKGEPQSPESKDVAAGKNRAESLHSPFEKGGSRELHAKNDRRGIYQIHVLGTHFNVNAYPNETTIYTTLLEGSVKVMTGRDKAMLTPGQQAQTKTNNPSIRITNNIDPDEVTAWQRGMFVFDNTDLTVLARQLSRWYDIDIETRGNAQALKLGGGISKNVPLSATLKVLEASGAKYKWENNKLIFYAP